VKSPKIRPDPKMRQKMAMGGTHDWDGPGILRSGPVCGCFMDDGVFDIYGRIYRIYDLQLYLQFGGVRNAQRPKSASHICLRAVQS